MLQQEKEKEKLCGKSCVVVLFTTELHYNEKNEKRKMIWEISHVIFFTIELQCKKKNIKNTTMWEISRRPPLHCRIALH
jgi:hypothetical protein